LNKRLSHLSLCADASTPADGNCLFWALKAAGSPFNVEDLRQVCITFADNEEMSRAGAQYLPARSADSYRRCMSKDGEWGDELMVICASRAHQKPVAVVAPSFYRTYYPDGRALREFDGSGLVVAFNGRSHYYGVKPSADAS